MEPPKFTAWKMFISERIRRSRQKAGFTVEQLAKRADLPVDFLRRVEACEHSPSHFARNKIAAATGVDPEFFEWDDDTPSGQAAAGGGG